MRAVRKEVGYWATEKAKEPRGLFSLTVPTGGGKTLASMLFALSHAVHHNSELADDDPHRFRRVIVVIPYLSIIEQTVAELVKVFGENLVLEHHSQAGEAKPEDFKKEKEDGPTDAREKRRRLGAENWDAPIVVTTSAQFFNSLFSRRPASARKLHNICQSLVIFDEVQTLRPCFCSLCLIRTQSSWCEFVNAPQSSRPAQSATQIILIGAPISAASPI